MDDFRRNPVTRGREMPAQRPQPRRATNYDQEPEFRESLAAPAPAARPVAPVETYRSPPVQAARSTSTEMVIYALTYAIEALLGFRFLLRLLQASASAPFVRFINFVTRPLVAPFTGVFGFPIASGAARLEAVTLFSMLVWGVVGFALILLARAARRSW